MLETHLQPSSRFVVEEVMIVEFRDVLHAFLFIHGLLGCTAMFERIKRSVSRWFKFSPSSRRRSGRRGPGVEPLETRVLLAMRVWDGGATLNDRWTDPTNWKDNIAPVAGDDLVFPDTVGFLDRGTRNDFPVNTSFGSITIAGGDYTLTGNRIQLSKDLVFQGLTNETAEIRFDVRFLSGSHAVRDVNSISASFILSGILSHSGAGELRIDASSGSPANENQVFLRGSSSNTFANPIIVDGGILVLGKSDNIRAIAGPLTVNPLGIVTVDRVSPVVGAIRNRVGQFLPGVPVTLTTSPGVLQGNTRLTIARETLGDVSLSDTSLFVVDVDNSTGGILTLTGDLMSLGDSEIRDSSIASQPAQVVFSQSAGARTFSVQGNLKIKTRLIGGSLQKAGAGTMVLAPREGGNAFSDLSIFRGPVSVMQSAANQIVLPVSIFIGGFGQGVTALSMIGTVQALPSNATIRVRRDGGLFMTSVTQTIRLLETVDTIFASQIDETMLTVTDDLLITRSRVEILNKSRVNITDDVDVTSGVLSVLNPNGLTIGDDLRLRGGRIFLSGSMLLGGDLTVNVDTVSGVASSLNGGGTLFLKSGTHDFTVADSPEPVDLAVLAVIRTDPAKTSGTASIVKRGLGRMLQNNPDLHDGTTLISQGEYLLNGILQSSPLSVANGGRLSGNGQAKNVVLNTGARFEPGEDDVGQFRATDFSFLFGSVFTPQLVSDTSFDQLQTTVLRLDQFVVNGEVLFPILDVQTTATFALGTAFKIVDVTGTGVPDLNKTFETTDGTPLPDGANFLVNDQNFTIDYNGGDGNDVVITRNNAPAFQNRRLTPLIFEGGIATLSGRITEPNAGDTFFLDVDWGDGKQETFTFGPDTPRQVRVRHRYLEDSDGLVNKRHTVNVEWRDQYGGGNKAQMSIRVFNTRPNFTHLQAIRVSPRNVQLAGILQDLGQHDAHRVLVQWNPGGRYESVTLTAGTTDFALQHRYAASGLKQIKVLVFDDNPGFTLRQLTIRV